MRVLELNGIIFREMLINALNNIYQDEKRLNSLNVFPVPDGDTGSNMRLTLENGVKRTEETESIGDLCKILSRGMLLGARGNSGVILSQLFKGISKYVGDRPFVNAVEFANALVAAYKNAYDAVVNPVEGTMLTVAREGIEKIINEVNEDTSINELLVKYHKSMKKSLANTPNLLPMLKDAGVVDSGGAGFIVICEGMIKYLDGELVESISDDDLVSNESVIESESDEFGYCTEFLLTPNAKFDMDIFKEELCLLGNSIVAIKDEDIVKVHIHTLTPGTVLNKAQEYGEFANLKIENMSVQHNETVRKKAPHKNIASIACASGEGVISLYKDFGCDIIIDVNSDKTAFTKAINSLNADNIIILPNDEKMLDIANDLKNNSIHVLPTKSLPDGYFALSMASQDEDVDINDQIDNMKSGFENVITITINNSDNLLNDVLDALKSVEGIEDKEIISIFKGVNVDIDDCEDIVSEIEDIYDAQVGIIEGEQDNFDIILGIS